MIFCPSCEPEKAGIAGWLSLKCIACHEEAMHRHKWFHTSKRDNPVVGISRCECGVVYGGKP